MTTLKRTLQPRTGPSVFWSGQFTGLSRTFGVGLRHLRSVSRKPPSNDWPSQTSPHAWSCNSKLWWGNSLRTHECGLRSWSVWKDVGLKTTEDLGIHYESMEKKQEQLVHHRSNKGARYLIITQPKPWSCMLRIFCLSTHGEILRRILYSCTFARSRWKAQNA